MIRAVTVVALTLALLWLSPPPAAGPAIELKFSK